ncbi:MAG: T9SS type A sorting domain-containing protein [Ferruginibacter sp.]
MKKLYLLVTLLCLGYTGFSQLTVTATATTPTICAGNSTALSASASPVGYTVSTVSTSMQPFWGMNILCQDGLDIAGLSAGNLDDGRWDGIALPFTFRFYGIDYSYVNVSTNGWVGLGFTNSVTTGMGTSLPAAAAPNAVIHAMTADLNFKPTTTSYIEYFEDGSAPNRIFVISYGNIKFLSGGGTGNVQVVLYETSNIIEIHTSDCSNTTLGKLQGIENSTGSVYSVVTGRNNTTNWNGTGYTNSYRFTPDVINYTWSPAGGLSSTTGASVTATPSATTTYTVNAVNPSNGFTGSNTVTVTINPTSYTLAGTAGGPQICHNISVAAGGTNYRDISNCNLIAKVVPAGASPVSNSINTCLTLATGSTKRGTTYLYGPRQYDIEPLINPATSTANVILYYPQSEFDDFNLKANDSGHKPLPTGPADAAGISNLTIRQFHGTGTNPNNYTGGYQDFTTASAGFTVVWDATRSWWEVTVPVTGFSGFYLTSKKTGSLPINLVYFRGVQVDKKHVLSWMVNCTSTRAVFDIERSGDGVHFTAIGNITASQLRCSDPFDFTDELPLAGNNYYRIRMLDVDGKTEYSNIVVLTLKTDRFELVNISPNPVTTASAKLKINAREKKEITITLTDFSGRKLQEQKAMVEPGMNEISIATNKLVAGAYLVSAVAEGEKIHTIRLVKQ